MEVKEFIATKNCKLSKLAEENSISYFAFNKALRKKDVLVNNKRVSTDVALNLNDKVKIFYTKSQVKPYTIIFEDNNILAVYKQPIITTEELTNQLQEKGAIAVHRLDRNTSGILMFAKNEQAEKALLQGLKNGDFEKFYLATVYGIPKKNHAILTAKLYKDAKKSMVYISQDRGVDIKTEYTVLNTYNNIYPHSELLVKLHTGKTHQIRAHLAYVGHFIIGDGKYGNEKINRAFKKSKQMLECKQIILHFNKNSFLYYLDNKVLSKGE